MNDDTPLPMECLAEDERSLAAIKDGTAALPFWLTPAEAIKDAEESIAYLKDHIATHGNTWATMANLD